MKIDADEKELLESVEHGDWRSTNGGKRERARYPRYAKATFPNDGRLSIRLSSKDPGAIHNHVRTWAAPSKTLMLAGAQHRIDGRGLRADMSSSALSGSSC